MERRFSIVFLLLSVSAMLPAQLQEGDTSTVRVLGSLSGILQSGNVEYRAIRGRIDWVVRPVTPWVWKSQNTTLYQEFFGRRSDNDVFSRNFLYYHPDRTIYPFLIAYVSSNFRRKLELRYFYGAGMTFRVLDSDARTMKVSAGLVNERSRFTRTAFVDPHYNGRSSVDLLRGTFWAGGKEQPFGSDIAFTYDAYWQPAFDGQSNSRWQTDLGAHVKIGRSFGLTMQYLISYEHLVVSGIARRDALTLIGFTGVIDSP